MYVKKLKRKCSVRGCKNTDTFAISRTREVGNSVIICKSCLGKALGSIDEIDPETKSNIPVADNTAPPSLFFNAKALGIKDSANTAEEPPAEDNDEETLFVEEQDNIIPPANEETEDVVMDDTQTDEEDNVENAVDEETPPEDDGFKCPECGKVFESEKGLKTHMRSCKAQTEE